MPARSGSRSRSRSSSNSSSNSRRKSRSRSRHNDRSSRRARTSYERVEDIIESSLGNSRITLYVEDFTDDRDVVESLLYCFRMRGSQFVGDVIDDAIESISRDFRSRREVTHPSRLVAARVKRSIRRRDEGLSPRRLGRRRSQREPSRSRSLSGVKPGRRVVVEEFARKYGVDAECEMRLKRLSQDQLQRVCGGDLIIHRDCRNVSSLIMARIRDEMQGRLPDVASRSDSRSRSSPRRSDKT
ncbi:Splicing factor, arginine/serine-rich, putative [Perkinsus marinus ATCC 50983]|uniref:Splicing factor, arginine/serine-rich, putative n=1 Tax=Perkinsus marinus (strain ATCC 50983 / TXsc) TaxID=423536 RepID=C5L1J9_PERM5|nr:Splicing factor, arginine/serine-rich, putative [Perkinsus marinus ATCC 50983]EER09426.1 Splicing factor, arginine/serine-rich, putative [Perkinsus marinus ATCC 50983]|eukprot:XP_002777610.1 Splicing factor, arginine/serine-rich, putative [Perkinsus marinus ATCC 50983]